MGWKNRKKEEIRESDREKRRNKERESEIPGTLEYWIGEFYLNFALIHSFWNFFFLSSLPSSSFLCQLSSSSLFTRFFFNFSRIFQTTSDFQDATRMYQNRKKNVRVPFVPFNPWIRIRGQKIQDRKRKGHHLVGRMLIKDSKSSVGTNFFPSLGNEFSFKNSIYLFLFFFIFFFLLPSSFFFRIKQIRFGKKILVNKNLHDTNTTDFTVHSVRLTIVKVCFLSSFTLFLFLFLHSPFSFFLPFCFLSFIDYFQPLQKMFFTLFSLLSFLSLESTVHHLRLDCGSDAVEFFEKNLEEMSGSLIHEHCSSFTYDRHCEKMDSNSGSINHSFKLMTTSTLTSITCLFITSSFASIYMIGSPL